MPYSDQPCTNEGKICRTVSEPAMVGDTTGTQPGSLDVPELRRILKQYRPTAAPDLQPLLSTLEQQLKGWEAGGNRAFLAGSIERTIRTIETLRQPSEELA